MFDFMATSLLLGDFVAVYLAFRVKHLTADYFLQTGWMALGKVGGTGWLMPLFSHAAIHSAGTAIVTLVFAPALWWLAVIDLFIHAAIDRTKSLPSCGSRWRPDQSAFWWCHGIDQEAHNLTHLAFVIAIVMVRGAS